MHVIAVNEELGHELEGKWGAVYARVWKQEGEGNYIVIDLLSQK